jgi:hypothetical protein
MLSNLWVGSTYEIFRLLVDGSRRLIAEPSDEFKALNRELRLLRIPIEKHEISGDRKLKTSLELLRSAHSGGGPGLYNYDKEDPRRAHIMPTRPSSRGSTTWLVTDIDQKKSYWIERRELSERIVALWDQCLPDAPSEPDTPTTASS